jgi:hypothetical protein
MLNIFYWAKNRALSKVGCPFGNPAMMSVAQQNDFFALFDFPESQ